MGNRAELEELDHLREECVAAIERACDLRRVMENDATADKEAAKRRYVAAEHKARSLVDQLSSQLEEEVTADFLGSSLLLPPEDELSKELGRVKITNARDYIALVNKKWGTQITVFVPVLLLASFNITIWFGCVLSRKGSFGYLSWHHSCCLCMGLLHPNKSWQHLEKRRLGSSGNRVR